MRHLALGTRFSIAFAAVALATALIAALTLTATWQRQFEDYVQRGVQERADAAAAVLAREYERAGSWSAVTFVELAHFGMLGDARVQVLDAEGNLIAWSRGAMGRTMMGGSPLEGAQVTAESVIMVDGELVGRVSVAQLRPGGMYSERDERFQRASLVGLTSAGVIAVLLASIAGIAYARGIARPIEAVTRVADALRRGEREARTGMTGGDPVTDLGQTLDQMADALEAERRFERQLTADVAHELRTPLQAIQATVEAMQDGVLPSDEERLGLIHDETVRLGRLAGSILELSALERGSALLSLREGDVAEPVAVAVEASRALMESTGHSLEERFESGVVARIDGERLTQAVGNLLSNAARYTPAGGVVRVTVTREAADAVIEVADSGMGVAPEDRERVFTRFWRADPARSRASGGLGIGLAVVREIVERHGGTVAVGVSDLGGAVFTIRIPLAR